MPEQEPDDIVQTEFGPIDRRSRRYLGYLVIMFFFVIATGISYGAITDADIWRQSGPSFVFIIVAMVYFGFVGIPAVAFFGQKEPKEHMRYRTSRQSSPRGRRPRLERRTTENGSGFTETVTYSEEQPQQTLETVVEGEPKTSKKEKAPEFSYKGELPKRKRKGYDG